MKILFVSTISNTVNLFLIPHINYLVKKGHQVDLAFNITQKIHPELINLGCKIHQVDFQRSPFKSENIKAFKKIKRLVLDNGYDLIHTHTPIASFIARFACRNITNLKVIYTAHGFHFFKGSPLLNWALYYPIEKVSARYTDAIITINEEDYIIAKKFKVNKSNFVYKIPGVGVNLEKFSKVDEVKKMGLRQEYGFNNEDFILFYAAELNYNKHQDLLINVVSSLKDKIPNIKLLLAGEGPLLNQYENQVKKLKLEENVCFLGYREDIPNIFKISDIAVSASRREGLPVNILEAMASGLPIISSNCRGNRDLIISGKNGYTIGIDDVEGFVNSIEWLYNSTKLREKFGQENIEMVKQYSLNSSINEMANIYSILFHDVKKCNKEK